VTRCSSPTVGRLFASMCGIRRAAAWRRPCCKMPTVARAWCSSARFADPVGQVMVEFPAGKLHPGATDAGLRPARVARRNRPRGRAVGACRCAAPLHRRLHRVHRSAVRPRTAPRRAPSSDPGESPEAYQRHAGRVAAAGAAKAWRPTPKPLPVRCGCKTCCRATGRCIGTAPQGHAAAGSDSAP